ncbi:helix-turn-helix transcriptional regulator [Mycolicibacterium smegmatis]|uniref:helix-turn-helix transcriptional regulator n=1 Tax=Mycolicibacterium smegmatis TaxID=1772 RepID=UPI0005D8E5AE|nr:helix-turn-helix transcriptional regulator [Mycolicibacterium smegmatis]MDF1900777.1 helix-turn-helix transcriptional regulator [Mycolicibacterium smegmatis]MDF1907056.1 helix-turn-helix transcriptional regulator [Mycolicibacterium smegmatis]MDF1919251.1 helix-turn-helix transcriptional regulator [Mycolicibacterium smegmatis]MDF1925318.1 helix-turn-helix transcriptional regulator [Mycolicibacterium smegmatis]UAK52894.1 helix-turn-helix transcriptional regulator [Mycolicibacterium smegmatis]
MTTGQLGEFLRARRSRLSPEDVGLARFGERRRVPGLRREELAQLAGVSVSYYTRLEQGQSVNASDAILDALADALQLDAHERRHLRELAAQRSQPARRPPAERVSALTRDLLRSLDNLPAIVVGRRTDILAWNALGHALFAGHVDPSLVDRPSERPNLARLLFLDPHTRELYADWERKARAVVGNLRLVAGRFPEDALLAGLIGELSMKSPEFVSLWADHRVKPCEADTYDLRHPLVGAFTVTQQNLKIARNAEQSLCLVTTAAGSASADTMELLARSVQGKNIQDLQRGGGSPGPSNARVPRTASRSSRSNTNGSSTA